jgi:hypothetical protein
MRDDSSLVSEIRQRAMKISEQHGHDLHRYCEYLRQKQREHPHRVVSQITVVPSSPIEEQRDNPSSEAATS